MQYYKNGSTVFHNFCFLPRINAKRWTRVRRPSVFLTQGRMHDFSSGVTAGESAMAPGALAQAMLQRSSDY